jgi:hypothetical protein
MQLEQIPVFVGVVVAILGLGVVLDAQLPEGHSQARERRRRERAERHRIGQTLAGLGVMAMAAALIGRDTWRFGTICVMAGGVLLGVGAWLNRRYLREALVFRGAARRGEKRSEPRVAQPKGAAPTGEKPPRAVSVPGLADSPPPREREPGTLRGDREAPILTAAEGLSKHGRGTDEDTPPDGHSRLRIR